MAGWAAGGRLDFFCRVPSARSNAVTTIAVAPGTDPDAIRRIARERFQVACAGGLGPLAGRALRIGHMGDLNEAMVLGAIAGVEAALRALRVDIGAGGVQAAVAALAGEGASAAAPAGP